MVKGRGGNILLREVDCKRSAMNSGDVFILDCDEGNVSPPHPLTSHPPLTPHHILL